MSDLSHLDEIGRPRMVDVSGKAATFRRAVVRASLELKSVHLAALQANPKGNVFVTAELAGIQAAKRCAELIPLCHQIPLSKVLVEIEQEGAALTIRATAESTAATGVEMEAYVAAAVAGLTLIDMLKGADPDLVLTSLRLIEKTGGKAPFHRHG